MGAVPPWNSRFPMQIKVPRDFWPRFTWCRGFSQGESRSYGVHGCTSHEDEKSLSYGD
ncbi:Myosin IC heavy chain [Frankliniella fusca]|uniref:Myosin IC heavy chain n=1 Tax=Frankliniella fusca TaxID=407009 RepID=A0AAE1LN08_9NEOP|nr:Myosin IC heavy chain [Frankliniella fusca]